MKVQPACIVLLILCCCVARGDDRPSFLWITAEDMSPALGCYGDKYAKTPNIDRLAVESVRYTHAFATAPVCSPVRSTLITGCYATFLGTHNMRSAMPLPSWVRGFPSFLREAGYYTSNNVKTDYNTADAARLIRESWNESSSSAHWRNRGATKQPFFAVFNLMTSHQSRTMVWPYEKFQADIQSRLSPEDIHDPLKAPLPPYYPDTAIVRREWARFHDCVTEMDQEVGTILQQLEDDGLAQNTIVFFFSDHGSGMPRHKRTLLDTGMHVPLLIRFPPKWQHLAPAKPGETTSRLVSFVDFPPTVLRLAELGIPQYMQGDPFLGIRNRRNSGLEPTDPETGRPAGRKYAFGHRDRVDEAFDCSRSVRSHRFLYIRNYMPHLSYNQPSAWPDQGDIRQEFYRLANRDTMTSVQWHFAGPTKPAEELYDCEADPLNLHNLAVKPEHSERLAEMRTVLEHHLTDSGDLGFIPEASLRDSFRKIGSGRDRKLLNLQSRIHRVVAGKSGLSAPEFFEDLPDGFWKFVGLRNSGFGDAAARPFAWPLSPDSKARMSDRIEAAHALVFHKQHEAALDFLILATRHNDLNIVLHATRTIELLGDRAQDAVPAIQDVAARCRSILPAATTATFVQSEEQDLAMFISFSANAFLSKHAEN